MTDVNLPLTPRPAVTGAAMMVLAGVCFALVNTLIQAATMKMGVAAPAAAFWQYLVAAVFFLPWIAHNLRLTVATGAVGAHILRVALSAGGIMLWTLGLAHVPIWQAIALILLSPFFVTLGAGLLLGEQVTPLRWAAVLAGFAGGAVILAPWSDAFTLAALYPVGAAVLWASVSLLTKRMTHTESAETLTLYLLIGLTPVNAVLAAGSGWAVSQHALPLIALAGILTAAAQYLIVRAYAAADAAYLQPFDHLKLPLNIGLGWLVFGFLPQGSMWLGTAMILAASMVLLRAEARGA
ncbi:DMT family transporter [Paracoccus jiaweipingae]|uniref:DMT family transporter n=1 Tax=unclassified Paracoccus (in: a-proteobacteria) TaxID=2688777 RepID=UPI0037B8F7AF